MNDFVAKQVEWMDLSKTLKYIQLGIQGAMAAQAIAAGFLSAAQKESLRASIAALPKLVAAAVSRAAAAVSLDDGSIIIPEFLDFIFDN